MNFYKYMYTNYGDVNGERGELFDLMKSDKARFPKCDFSHGADWHALLLAYFKEVGADETVFEDCWTECLEMEKSRGKKIYNHENWFEDFLNACCETGEEFVEQSGRLYDAYRAYCMEVGRFTKSTTEFYAALNLMKFQRRKKAKGSFIYGLRLNPRCV